MPLVIPKHALARIAERFPGIDIHNEYAQARRISAKSKYRKRIKQHCPKEAKRWMASGYSGRYYLISRGGMVFVMAPPEIIVTVFRLEKPIDHAEMEFEA